MVDLNAKYTPTGRLHAGHTLSSMQQTKLLDLIHIASFARNSRPRKVGSEGLEQELEALAKIKSQCDCRRYCFYLALCNCHWQSEWLAIGRLDSRILLVAILLVKHLLIFFDE